MIIACQSCGTTYNIADEKVRGRRVRVRCKTCGAAMVVDGQQLPPEDQTRPMRLEDATASYTPNQHFDEEDESTRVMSAPPMFGRPIASGTRSAPPPPPLQDEWTVNYSDTDSRTMSLAEIVDAYTSGLIPEDAFAWKPGMDDWLPVAEVPEIRDAIASASPTKVANVASVGRGAVAHAAPIAAPQPAQSPKARNAGGGARLAARAPSTREQRGDLFSRAGAAGSEEELLASTSEPPERYEQRPTGARNESSVLFSLDTVKAGRVSTSAPPKAAIGAPKTAADILGLGSSSAPSFDMSTNAALLTAPAPEPEPEPVRVVSAPPRARMDTTPPVARRSRSGLVWMLVGILGTTLVLGTAGLAFMISRGMPPPFPVPEALARYVPGLQKAEATPGTTTAAPSAATPPVASVVPPATTTASAAPAAASAEAAPQPTVTATPPTTGVTTPPAGGAHAAPRPAAPKPGTTPESATKPAAGGAIPNVVLEEEPGSAAAKPAGPPFDTAAAKAALEGAAAAAAGCKQADGPTGKGKVQVTFASSGRATSANIIAGDFGGTAVGGCVARAFRAAKVPAFSGDPVTVSKSFSVE